MATKPKLGAVRAPPPGKRERRERTEYVVSVNQSSQPYSDEEKLLAIFRIIDDPRGWYDTLDTQQRILLRGWLRTGNRLFAKALLNKMLPEQVHQRILVSPLESVPRLIMQAG